MLLVVAIICTSILVIISALQFTLGIAALRSISTPNKIWDTSKSPLPADQLARRSRTAGTLLIITGTLSLALSVFFGVTLFNLA